eukprot:1138926-Pelagomonas_calceolata.AAC.1
MIRDGPSYVAKNYDTIMLLMDKRSCCLCQADRQHTFLLAGPGETCLCPRLSDNEFLGCSTNAKKKAGMLYLIKSASFRKECIGALCPMLQSATIYYFEETSGDVSVLPKKEPI